MRISETHSIFSDNGSFSTMRQACFFDRDGVIIEEADYIHDPAQVRLCPFAADAIRAMHDAGRLVIVVSNQSGIARGYSPRPT